MSYESRELKAEDRLIFVNRDGKVICREGGVAKVPAEFDGALQALSSDLQLALDCMQFFGCVPIPVARAILRNLEPVQAALDLALKTPGKVGN